jgi:MATE family multidrug resistance protein
MVSDPSLDHKIWRIAWPAILSNISIPVLGLVDAAILGHLGDSRYLGAVAIGSAILTFLYWGFGFLRMGTTGLVARAMGAGDEAGANLVLARSIVLAVTLAGLVLLLSAVWLPLGLAMMAPRAELHTLAASYADIRIASAPAVLATYAVVGWFIGRQNTRWPMVVVVSTNLFNIGLDWVLIIGLGLGSDGAAIATVCAEYIGCCLALWGVWQQLPQRPGAELWRQLREWTAYRQLLKNNQHLFFRTVCLLASFAFFTAQGDKLGTHFLAANTLLLHLLMLAAYAMDGFAFAVEGLAGSRLGAGDLQGFHQSVRRCAWWCGLTAVATSLLFALLHPLLFSLLTNIAPVREQLYAALGWLLIVPLVAAPSYLLDGVFIGGAETRYMMTTMVFSAAIIYLPVWYVSRGLGNDGLWLAFTLFNGARGVTLFWYYRKLSRDGLWLEPVAKHFVVAKP